MRRRKFISLVGGAAIAWPLAARAQQGDQVRRIGVLTPLAENDLDGKSRDAAFRERLDRLGWVDGRNVHIDLCSGRYLVPKLPEATSVCCPGSNSTYPSVQISGTTSDSDQPSIRGRVFCLSRVNG
jgi:hypothetical protein